MRYRRFFPEVNSQCQLLLIAIGGCNIGAERDLFTELGVVLLPSNSRESRLSFELGEAMLQMRILNGEGNKWSVVLHKPLDGLSLVELRRSTNLVTNQKLINKLNPGGIIVLVPA